MNGFRLALRLLWRDGRSGELTILLCALVIAVSCSTAITLFADRLQRTMTLQAAEFLLIRQAFGFLCQSLQELKADNMQYLGMKLERQVLFPLSLVEALILLR